MKQSLQVSILGQTFHLRSDSSPEQVRRIAEFVEGQIHEVTAAGRATDTLQAAVLALLNVSARYLQGEKGDEALPADAAERLRQLVVRIERSVGEAC